MITHKQFKSIIVSVCGINLSKDNSSINLFISNVLNGHMKQFMTTYLIHTLSFLTNFKSLAFSKSFMTNNPQSCLQYYQIQAIVSVHNEPCNSCESRVLRILTSFLVGGTCLRIYRKTAHVQLVLFLETMLQGFVKTNSL